jgi:hypothetical protein
VIEMIIKLMIMNEMMKKVMLMRMTKEGPTDKQERMKSLR